MKPLDPSSQTLASATLGYFATEKDHDTFAQWADAHNCPVVVNHLLCTLNAFSHSRWLVNVTSFLTSRSTELVQWENLGVDTFGLARLATLLVSDGVGAVLGNVRSGPTSVVSDYPKGATQTYYLQMALVCRSHKETEYPSVDRFQQLRLWLLLEAMRRSAQGVVLDQNLQTIAKVVRQAGEDRHKENWYPFLMGLLGPHKTPQAMTINFLNTCSNLLSDKQNFPTGTAKRQFLEALLSVSRGDTDDYTQTEDATLRIPSIYSGPVENADFPSPLDLTPTEELAPEESIDPEAESTGGGDGVATFELDPNLNNDEHKTQARYVILTNSAHARLVGWDWDVVNPHEQKQLDARIRSGLRSTDKRTRLISAITEICLVAARSMNMALRMRIGHDPGLGKDWCFDIPTGQLRRCPPRRNSHAKPKPSWEPLVPSEAQAICHAVSPECVMVISAEFESTGAGAEVSLLAIWPFVDKTPTQAFVDWLEHDPALWRLTPGMLGSVAQRDSLQECNDWLKSRLLYSQPDEGLPAAASYASYRQPETHGYRVTTTPTDFSLNAAGGRIDADEEQYVQGFARLYGRIRELSVSPDYMEFSNCVNLYWDTALRAATGVRPGEDLWVWKYFDWNQGFVFVDDKTGIDPSAARWIPVPFNLLEAIASSYREQLAPVLCALLTQEFGEEASRQACDLVRSGLCWLVREGAILKAQPLGQNQRSLMREFTVEHPLPANALRHRARNVWRRLGLNQEIIDGFMSHGDGATRTHGDFSPRVWELDADLARPVLAQAYAALEVKIPPSFQPKKDLNAIERSYTHSPDHNVRIVDAHRQATRWRVLLGAAREAQKELSLHICQADLAYLPKLQPALDRLSLRDARDGLAKLDRSKTDRLVKSLKRTRSGTPATLGDFRLLWLTRLAEQIWKYQSVKIPLHKRSFAALVQDKPTASVTGVGAHQRFHEWRTIYATICKKLDVSAISPADAAALLTLELLLVSRVADDALVGDAVVGKVKVVTTQGRFFVEWAGGLSQIPDGRGVIRIRISSQAAHYLSVIQAKKVLYFSELTNASSIVRTITDTLLWDRSRRSISLATLCSVMCKTVDALNCQELAGNVAAFRGGRLRTAALSWRDWLYLQKGLQFDTDVNDSSAQATPDLNPDLGQTLSIQHTSLADLDARKAAKVFFEEVRSVLDRAYSGGMNLKVSPKQRLLLQTHLEKVWQSHATKVSASIHMLGSWALALFDKRRTGDLLSIGAIARYVGALSPRFEALLHSVDLRTLDEEELTNQMHQLLAAGDVQHPEYVKARLREFFSHCARTHGLASPNWSELHVEDKAIGISPGYVAFSTYCRVLTRVRYRAGLDDATGLRAALFTMLSYRFGLRKGEAAGMRWRDWINVEGLMYVIINDWKARDVKSPGSRRVVPLLWSLTSFEKRLLEDHSVLMKQHVKTDPKALFLSYPADPAREVNADYFADVVSNVMKSVGGRHLTHHHSRHTFAANVWSALELPPDQAQSAHRTRQREQLRQLLLQSSDVGRRGPWVLARLLGHTHPAQSFKSYIHFLCDFSDRLTYSAVIDCDNSPSWNALQELDDFAISPRPPRTAVPPQETRSLSIREVLWALRLLGEGLKPDQVSRALRTSIQWVNTASTALLEIEARVFPGPRRQPKREQDLKKHPSAAVQASVDLVVEAAQPKFTFRKLGASKLLSHVLQSKLEPITVLLDTALKDLDPAQLPTVPALDVFVAAFGAGMQVSLWKKDQMIFFRWAFEIFKIERARLQLLVPPNLVNKVVTLAQSTGWIQTTDSTEISDNEQTAKTQIFPLSAQRGRQDVVVFGELGDIVRQRLSVRLESDESVVIGNRYELVLSHLSCWLWLVSRLKSV